MRSHPRPLRAVVSDLLMWLVRSLPGRVFLLGLVLAAVSVASAFVTALLDPAAGAALLGQIGAHAVLGREAGIPLGLTLGLPALAVWTVSVALDLLLVLFGLPVLVTLERPLRQRFQGVDRWFARMETEAGARRGATLAGVAGLVGMSVLPFIPMGALAAGVTGILLGFGLVPLLALIALSLLAVNALFVLAGAWATEALMALHPAAPPVLVAGVLLLLLASVLLRRARPRGQPQP